jgi:hypothetical protein
MFVLIIDDVTVEPMPPDDVAIIATTIPSTLIEGTSATFSATIRNEGINTQTALPVRLMKKGLTTTDPPTILASTTIATLASQASQVASISWIPTQGYHEIYFEVELSGDENPLDNVSAPTWIFVYSADTIIQEFPTTGTVANIRQSPFDGWFNNSIAQSIYPRAQVVPNTALHDEGVWITSLTYTLNPVEYRGDLIHRIYMANTNATAIGTQGVNAVWLTSPAASTANWTLVYQGPINIGTGSGPRPVTISLTTPFFYNTAHATHTNLVITTNRGHGANTWVDTPGTWTARAAAANSSVWNGNDNTVYNAAGTIANGGTRSANIPVTTFTYQADPPTGQTYTLSGIAYADFLPAQGMGANLPLPNAVVSLLGTPFSTTTNAAGQFSLADVPANARISVSKMGYQLYESALLDLTVSTTYNPQVLVGELFDNTGTVVAAWDEDIKIEGARLTFTLSDGQVYHAISDTDGEFSFPIFKQPYTYSVVVSHLGYDHRYTTLTIDTSGAASDVGDILMYERNKAPAVPLASVETTGVEVKWIPADGPISHMAYTDGRHLTHYGWNLANTYIFTSRFKSDARTALGMSTDEVIYRVSFVPNTVNRVHTLIFWAGPNSTGTNLWGPNVNTELHRVVVPANMLVAGQWTHFDLPVPVRIPHTIDAEATEIYVGLQIASVAANEFPAPADHGPVAISGEQFFNVATGTNAGWYQFNTANWSIITHTIPYADYATHLGLSPVAQAPAVPFSATASMATARESALASSSISSPNNDFVIPKFSLATGTAPTREVTGYRLWVTTNMTNHTAIASHVPLNGGDIITDTSFIIPNYSEGNYRYVVATVWNADTEFEMTSPRTYTPMLTIGANDGSIIVEVDNEVGMPIEGANVTITYQADTSILHHGVTNSIGAFTQIGIPFGVYEVAITRDGYLPHSEVVTVTGSTTIEVTMSDANFLFTAEFPGTEFPGGWINLDIDGDEMFWTLRQEGMVFTPRSDSYCTDREDCLFPDNWLITPEINLPLHAEARVSFSLKSESGDDEIVTTYVITSPLSNDPAVAFTQLAGTFAGPMPNYDGMLLDPAGVYPSFPEWAFGDIDSDHGEVVDHYHAINNHWNPRVGELGLYAGQTVRLAFRHWHSMDNMFVSLANIAIKYKYEPGFTTVRGIVQNSLTEPLSGATVTFGTTPPVVVTTDAMGMFEILDVAFSATPYTISVTHPDYADFTGDDFTVDSEYPHFVITMDDMLYSVSGTIVDEFDGEGIAGVLVELFDFADSTFDEMLDIATTDADGDFEIVDLAVGDYKLRLTKDGYNLGVYLFSIVDENYVVEDDIVLYLERFMVSGNVVDSDDTMITTFTATLSHADFAGDLLADTDGILTGEFLFDGLLASDTEYTLTIAATGYLSRVETFMLGPDIEFVDLGLLSVWNITGIVVTAVEDTSDALAHGRSTTPDTVPVADALVTFVTDIGYEVPPVTTGADGSFTIPNIIDGIEYQINISKSGFLTKRLYDLEVDGEDLDLDEIELIASLTLSGRVVDADTVALAGVRVTISHADIHEFGDPRVVYTDADGLFEIEQLLPLYIYSSPNDVYTLEFFKLGYVTKTTTHGLTAYTTDMGDIELDEKFVLVHGIVERWDVLDGQAVAEGAFVTLFHETYQNPAISFTIADSSAFAFDNVREGEDYVLTVTLAGHRTHTIDPFDIIDTYDAGEVWAGQIILNPSYTVSGMVKTLNLVDDDPEYLPIEGATVVLLGLNNEEEFTTLTNAAGEYSFDDITNDGYMLTISKEHYRTVETDAEVYFGNDEVDDIILTRVYTLAGAIMRENPADLSEPLPAPAAVVTLISEDLDVEILITIAENGEFSVGDLLAADDYTIAGTLAGHFGFDIAIDIPAADPLAPIVTFDHTFELHYWTLLFTVEDAQGDFIEGAVGTLNHASLDTPLTSQQADGEQEYYVFTGIYENVTDGYALSVVAGGYMVYIHPTTITFASENLVMDLRETPFVMTTGFKITGVVYILDVTTEEYIPVPFDALAVPPLPAATIVLSDGGTTEITTMSGTAGTYAIEQLLPFADWTLTATFPGFMPAYQTVSIVDSNLVINFYLDPPISGEDHFIPAIVTTLGGNYPNPFNPSTTISFSTATDGFVRLDIFNVKGQRVASVVNDHIRAGNHTVMWNGKDEAGRDVASGVYFYRMQTDDFSAVRKMMMIK